MKQKRTWVAGKPKKKPGFDPEAITKDILDAVVKVYGQIDSDGRRPSLQAIVDYLEAMGCGGMNPIKVRKLLITAGVYESATADQVKCLAQEGRSGQEIMDILQLSRSSVQSYLPYKRIIYKLDESGAERSVGADREQLFRNRKKAVDSLAKEHDERHLWNAILLFAGYPFVTKNGSKFTYEVKDGGLLFGGSKKLIEKSTVITAYLKLVEDSGQAAGAVFDQTMSGEQGGDYLYVVFQRIGVFENDARIL